MNTDATKELEEQAQEIRRALRNATAERSSLHWRFELNRREITKNQALLRANKIARQALQEEQ